jgi:hypothetical protein
MSVEVENPLDEFLLEAQALPHPRNATPAVPDPKLSSTAAPRASIHELPAAMEGRLSSHISRESADTRRRLTELKRSIESALANQSGELQRLTWVVKFAIYVLLAISMAQFGLIVWTRGR